MSALLFRHGSRRCLSILKANVRSISSINQNAKSSDEKYVKVYSRLEDVDQKNVTVASNRDLHPANTETHTGQMYDADDYRNVRFINKGKLVNTRFAINYIQDDPVVVCEARGVWSDSGGPLGHPKVYINLDKPIVHSCGYSGRKFIQKKYYDKSKHGPSITYDEYISQVRNSEDCAYDSAQATPFQ